MPLDNLPEKPENGDIVEELLKTANARKEELLQKTEPGERESGEPPPRRGKRKNKVLCTIRVDPDLKKEIEELGRDKNRYGFSEAIRYFAKKGLEAVKKEREQEKKKLWGKLYKKDGKDDEKGGKEK